MRPLALAPSLLVVFALASVGCADKKPAESPPPPGAGGTSLYNEPAPKGTQADRAADVEQKADEANTRLARVTATAIRVGAAIWLAHDDRCPTMQDLITIKFVNEKVQPNDPWGSPYTITCATKDPIVTSAGPDGKTGTPDDIVIGLVAK
jgi:hypothetical protein